MGIGTPTTNIYGLLDDIETYLLNRSDDFKYDQPLLHNRTMELLRRVQVAMHELSEL